MGEMMSEDDLNILSNPDAVALAKLYTKAKADSADPANFDNEENMISWFSNNTIAKISEDEGKESEAADREVTQKTAISLMLRYAELDRARDALSYSYITADDKKYLLRVLDREKFQITNQLRIIAAFIKRGE